MSLSAPSAKLRVVTTLPDFASLAEDIGGGRVQAQALILGTQNPHFVDPKPSFILAVNQADLLVCIGMQLEAGWLPVLLTQSRNHRVQVGSPGYLDASIFITPKEVPNQADRSMGDVHASGNPHYYTSPTEMFKVARGIYSKLVELDPEGRSQYTSSWTRFRDHYKSKLEQWHQKVAGLRGKPVVVYHTSWIYFLDWAGLRRLGALEPKPGIPPSAAHITRLIAATRSQGVYQVWREIYHPDRLSALFAKKVDARLIALPSMVGAAPDIQTVVDKFDRMIELVSETGRNPS